MSIQESVNQLLGITAIATKMSVGASQAKYAEQRGEEYNKAYQAQLEATKAKYTKSGALSKSKEAKLTAQAAEAAQPGPASKLPWNKETEKKLAEEQATKLKGLKETEAKGVKNLKETTQKAKDITAKQFGQYEPISQQLLSKMSPEDRWKVRAQEKLMQKEAYAKFLEDIQRKESK